MIELTVCNTRTLSTKAHRARQHDELGFHASLYVLPVEKRQSRYFIYSGDLFEIDRAALELGEREIDDLWKVYLDDGAHVRTGIAIV